MLGHHWPEYPCINGTRASLPLRTENIFEDLVPEGAADSCAWI